MGITGRLCDQGLYNLSNIIKKNEILFFILECPEGTFGRNCSETCQCKNGARCNKLTGCCSCTIGYYGTTCQFRKKIDQKKIFFSNKDLKLACRPFTYGFYCTQTCNCSTETSDGCDPQTGKCRCKSGYQGDQCEISKKIFFLSYQKIYINLYSIFL